MRRLSTRSLSLRTVLVATLILPLLTSMAFGGVWARDRQREAAHAEVVAAQIDMLSILSQLQFGIETDRLFRGTNQSLLPEDIRAAAAAAAQPKTRKLWANGEKLVADPTALDGLTEGRGSELLTRVLGRHDIAVADPLVATRDADLAKSSEDLRVLIKLVRDHADRDAVARTAVFDQFSDLQALMLVEAQTFITAIGSPTPSAKDVLAIYRTAAQEDALINQIVKRLDAPLRRQLLNGLAADDMEALRDGVAVAAGIEVGPTFAEVLTPDRMGKVQGRYFALPEIREQLAATVTAESAAAIQQSHRWVQSAIAVALALVTMTVGTAAIVSRLVIRRLRLLAAAASRIGDGDIDDDPLPAGGPKEIARVTIAFNRMSDLLLTLDRQVGAIGAARLDDPSLDKALPGRIGSEIQQSVQLIAQTTERLRDAQAFAAAIIEAAVDAIITVDDDGTIRSANPAAITLAKADASAVAGTHIEQFFTNLPSFSRLIAHGDTVAVELERRNGDSVSTLVSAREIRGSDGTPRRAFFIRDISERAAWEERFRYQATHDELTDLPNRFALGEHLQALEDDVDDERIVAVLCVDIDRFKYVNDAHGHQNGDHVIGVVADRLRAVAGPHGYVARIDGDEFALVVRRESGDPTPHETAELVMASLAEAIEISNERLALQSCVGIAIADTPNDTTEELLRFAEVALSIAKQSGSGSVSTYDEGMSALIERRTRLEQRLRTALATDQLEMFAQPIVDLRTQRISGVELLARWRYEGEWIPPDVFIPIAEESGLIQALGRWAMGCACKLLAEFDAAGCEQTVSVNISGLHLIGGEVATELAALLVDTTFDRSRLRVELTESFLLDDPEMAAVRLNEIRALGASIVIDDFGTGYSSLTYLHALPIDGLKLDRSFVSRLGVDASDETIVRLVNDLAVGLHLDLVAEGVETTEQHRSLVDHGYTKGQGYLWSRPVPIGELWPMLHKDHLGVERELTPTE